MMKLLRYFLCITMILTTLTVSVFAFPDVTQDYDWAKSAITNLSQKGYINGYTDGTFGPEKNITRAEFTKLITLMFGNKATVSYEDVSEKDWFYPYVTKSGGYFVNSELFMPQKNITRQEVAYAIYVALKPTKSLTDKSVSFRDLEAVDETYVSAVKALAHEEILNGYPDGTFGPHKEITRAEIAMVLERALNYKKPESNEGDNNNQTEQETLKANNYFFVVSRVSTVVNEHNELITKVEGFQDGKLTTLLIDEDVTITKSAIADDNRIDPGDVISYSRNLWDEVNRISIGLNANNLPRENRIELLSIGNTTKRHIAVGTVKETYKQKGIDLISLAGDTEKVYEVNNPVYVYELKSNGKIELSDFLEINDSRYETGDTVIAFSYDDVLYEILVIKE